MSAHAAAVLACHRPQGRSNDCGPFSAAMVINALTGAGEDAGRLAREMDRPRQVGLWPVVRRVPRGPSFPWGLADLLRAHGVRAGWRALARAEDLHAALARGHVPLVVVGSLWPVWGHVMVLLAHDPARGWGFADPARATGELAWLADPVFRRQWSALGRLVVEAVPPYAGPKAGRGSRRLTTPGQAASIRARGESKEVDMSTVKVIELVGSSTEGWQQAAEAAVQDAARTLKGLTGVEVVGWTASCDENGNVTLYKANVKVAFRVREQM